MKRTLTALTLCAAVLGLTMPGRTQDKPAAAPAPAPANVAGMWKMKWEGRMGPMEATLKLEQTGETAKGTLAGNRGGGGGGGGMSMETPVQATVKGNELKFTVTRETPRGTMNVAYTAMVVADTLKGKMDMGQFSVDWTAIRVKEEKK
ncbi:MAG: hypothetical protein FJY97_03825 [candidate division Zixibacteria bacterium]|nr:hypothetical protein [candidate division Zixibacteria bacterium]